MSLKVSTILDQIDLGQIALPKFQRGFVWNRDQVRSLIESLYLGHPVGSLLLWNTRTEIASANARGDGQLSLGSVKLLLDGQQRITSLYSVIRGKEPPFFEGDLNTFINLYFNVSTQAFEFYSQQKMSTNPLWISVTELMQKNIRHSHFRSVTDDDVILDEYMDRLNILRGIKDKSLNYEEVDSSKDVDEVVEIFNKVNSGGTKLSKGDLALAKICAAWPDARDELRLKLAKWENAGYEFELDWLLRIINAVLTNTAFFSALKDVATPQFKIGLSKSEKLVDYLLNLLSSRLGIDHDRVLGSRYSFPVMSRYIEQCGGNISDHREIDKLLYWYIHTFLWGRYAGSTESVINQDLEVIDRKDGALERLINQLRQNRGDLRLQSGDFGGWGLGSRFYPLLYMMSRVCKTRDLGSGLELSAHMLGSRNNLQVHHIFPKDLLYKKGCSKAEVNAVANLTFLTMETNLKFSNRPPSEYLAEVMTKQPSTIETHWIPIDSELWKLENYGRFLEERRKLLADAANTFLNRLLNGGITETPVGVEIVPDGDPQSPVKVGELVTINEEEEKVLRSCNHWIEERLLPLGNLNYQLTDENGKLLAVFDLAWPKGLQEGYSEPVALLLDEPQEVKDTAQRFRFRYFTSVSEFQEYVEQEILSLA